VLNAPVLTFDESGGQETYALARGPLLAAKLPLAGGGISLGNQGTQDEAYIAEGRKEHGEGVVDSFFSYPYLPSGTGEGGCLCKVL